jgi:hypothetical protein
MLKQLFELNERFAQLVHFATDLFVFEFLFAQSVLAHEANVDQMAQLGIHFVQAMIETLVELVQLLALFQHLFQLSLLFDHSLCALFPLGAQLFHLRNQIKIKIIK